MQRKLFVELLDGSVGGFGIIKRELRPQHRNRGILLFTLQILRFLSNYICNYCARLSKTAEVMQVRFSGGFPVPVYLWVDHNVWWF